MAAGEQNRGRRQRPTARKTAAAKPAKAKPGARATGAGRPPSRTRPLPCELTLAVMEGAVEGVIIAERQSGKIRYANATAGRMFACSPAELAGGNISSLHPKENLAAVRQVFDAQGRGESSLSKSIPCQRRDGSVFWADISTARLLLHDTPCIIGFFSDVTGQKAARDEIEEAHALFSGVFNAVPDILGIQDTQHGVVRYNEAGYRFLNIDASGVQGKRCFELIGRDQPCSQCATSETYRTKKPARLEKFVETRGVWLDVRAYPILDQDGNLRGIVEHLRDITLQKRAEADLLRNEKLASLAILAGGIAHDFNNLLVGIYGNIEMARTSAPGAETADYLEATLRTMDRAKGLTQQLLTFAKGGAPLRQAMLLDDFLRKTTAFACSGSRVSCITDVEPGLWAAEYDANQLGQALDNILINAQQAMPAGGTIDVSARNVMVGAGEVPALAAGRYVRVSVRDQGSGIPRGLMGRIFDPFFTTKPQGSGLGLSTSFSIVSQHGGTITVESEQGQGSVFHLFLPACPAPAAVARPAEATPTPGGGRILVMDDEQILREAICAMLQLHGYETVAAADGAEALRLFDADRENGAPFTAVILDLTVPGGMGGKETVAAIRKRDERVPVFVASGYADDPILARPREYGFTASIAKPFTRKDLIAILCQYM
jgi:PAS domain S-box-containing protein